MENLHNETAGIERVNTHSFIRLWREATGTEVMIEGVFDRLPPGIPVTTGNTYSRIALAPINFEAEPKLIEIVDDVVVGVKRFFDDEVSLDLSPWRAFEFGISRCHMRIQPSFNGLHVIDLDSTNGTYINGLRIEPGWAQPIQDGDLLTLGKLHIRVKVLDS